MNCGFRRAENVTGKTGLDDEPSDINEFLDSHGKSFQRNINNYTIFNM
jgi:hypothetical protein